MFRGTKTDVGVSPLAFNDGAGHRAVIIQRYISFFEAEYFLVGPKGTAKLALPSKSDIWRWSTAELIVSLREDWTTADGNDIPARIAACRSISLRRARHRNTCGRRWCTHPDRAKHSPRRRHARPLLVVVLDNVKGRALRLYARAPGNWSRRELALPDNASVHIVDADLHSDRAFVSVTGFLTPPSLWLADVGSGALAVVKTLPAQIRRLP